VRYSTLRLSKEFILTHMPRYYCSKACFIPRILAVSNAIKKIDEMINLIKLHYLLFELHSTRPKFDG
jgi:hypothetical protein